MAMHQSSLRVLVRLVMQISSKSQDVYLAEAIVANLTFTLVATG